MPTVDRIEQLLVLRVDVKGNVVPDRRRLKWQRIVYHLTVHIAHVFSAHGAPRMSIAV